MMSRMVVVWLLIGACGRLEERVEQVVGYMCLVEGAFVVSINTAVFVPSFAVPVPCPRGFVELVGPRFPLRAGPLPLRFRLRLLFAARFTGHMLFC